MAGISRFSVSMQVVGYYWNTRRVQILQISAGIVKCFQQGVVAFISKLRNVCVLVLYVVFKMGLRGMI